jgi:hypothetical protein
MPPAATALSRSGKPNISPAEWEQRVNLAACYRLVEHFGWTDLIYTHISARVPGAPGHFLLNRFGLLFDEVTASNLIKVDLDGNLVDEPDAPCTRRVSSSTAPSTAAAMTSIASSTPIPKPAWRLPPCGRDCCR